MPISKQRKAEIRQYLGVYNIKQSPIYDGNAEKTYKIADKEFRKEEEKQKRKEMKIRSEENTKNWIKNVLEKPKKQRIKKIKEPTKLIDIRVSNSSNNAINRLLMECNKLVGKNMVFIQSSMDGNIFRSGLEEIKGKDAKSIFWDIIHSYMSGDGSDENIFRDFHSYARIVVFDTNEIPSERLQQKYRDGKTHCVFHNLVLELTEKKMNTKNSSSIKRYEQRLNRLKKDEEIYKDGVPEELMEDVAIACGLQIQICNLFGGIMNIYNSKCSSIIQFTNTRQNHLEQGVIFKKKRVAEPISKCELEGMIERYNKEDIKYIYTKNQEDICLIASVEGTHYIPNEDKELYDNFNKITGIKNYGIDAVKYNDLNEFIKQARLINATPVPLCNDPNNITSQTHELDVSKAYTQHRYCKNYIGFLGHIHKFCRFKNVDASDFIKNHIGIYKFKVIENKDKLLLQLGIKSGLIYTLPSAEIIDMMEYGVKIVLIAGCYGSKFDFDYTDEMLMENSKGQKRYALWAGKLGQDSTYNKYITNGTQEWASHLKNELGDDNVFYFKNKADILFEETYDVDAYESDSMIILKKQKESYKTYHHVLAFITSYTRMNMMAIMRQVKGELVKVILDGIYFRGEIPDVIIPNKIDKNLKEHICFRDHWFYPTESYTDNWEQYTTLFDKNVFLSGGGGSGKSHSVFTCKSLIEPLYVVPAKTLGNDMEIKYGCKFTTINCLTGIGLGDKDCKCYKDMVGEPSVIFIDELTMIRKDMIEKALELYPNSRFILAGDIDDKQWFQCRSGDGDMYNEIFMGKGFERINYTNDYRSKCDELKKFKVDVRNKMKEIFTDGGHDDAYLMNEYIMEEFPTISFEKAINDFKQGDIFLAGTKKTNLKLLEKGIISGYKTKDKEVNFEGNGSAFGSFTIHSFQGITIPKKKVFIRLDLFEYAMLYTAISRCCYLNQIIFVE